MTDSRPSSSHADAVEFGEHLLTYGYPHYDVQERLGAEKLGDSDTMWIVGGHAISTRPGGASLVCPKDCPEKGR